VFVFMFPVLQIIFMCVVFLWQVDFTADEHDAVQSALRQHLGPSFISQRVGAGGQKVCLQFGIGVCISCGISFIYSCTLLTILLQIVCSKIWHLKAKLGNHS